MNTMIPEVFKTGKIPNGLTDKDCVGMAYLGWALCGLGKLNPEEKDENGNLKYKFGEGMSAIASRLGIAPTQENLTKYSKEKGWIK